MVQNGLFHLGSDLCILEEDKAALPAPRIEERHVRELEPGSTARRRPAATQNFVLPGGRGGGPAARSENGLPPRSVASSRCRTPKRWGTGPSAT